MSKTAAPTSGVSRLTSLTLGLVILLCVTLIGGAGYLKYQLDRAEAVLAAPEAMFASDQDASVKLRRALGYSGFVSAGQNFLASRDRGAVAEMKAQLKNAQDVIARLPEKTSPEARHDLQSIVDLFAATAQKADQSTTDNSVSFISADMAPLYAALPVLDARVESAMATSRFAAQNHLKLWATLLTLIAWMSLVIAIACAVGFYLSLRGHKAAPFRALAQSVQNMARGDMRTPIWGMERQDMVGELARAIDLARYHFSQLPDMSLLSDQGPMRIRFEGQARSLFEAMMQNIARDSESIRSQTAGLAESINQQKEALIQAITSMFNDRQNTEQQVQQLLHGVGSSAQSLRGAQQTAEAQLTHLIAYLEERAKGMAEVTQIAGKQVAHTLQSLAHTEQNLRSSAEQNQETVRKLANSTDELGERLFGAVSLLRAGGKVLAETAEATQGRLNEAISLLSQSEGSLRQMLVQGFEPVGLPAKQLSGVARAADAERMQSIVNGLEAAQRKLDECLAHQSEATSAQIEMLASQSSNLLTQVSSTTATLANVTDHLRHQQDRFGESGVRFANVLENLGGRLEQRVMETLGRADGSVQSLNRLTNLGERLGEMVDKLAALETSRGAVQGEIDNPSNLLMEIKAGFEITTRSIERLREEFIGAAMNGTTPVMTGSTEQAPQWQAMVEQIMNANDNLAQIITQQSDRIETRLMVMDKKIASPTTTSTSSTGMTPDEAQTQLQQQAQILAELASALGAIDIHMQEMGAKFKNLNAHDDDRMAS